MSRSNWVHLFGSLLLLLPTQLIAGTVIDQDVVGNGGGSIGDGSHTLTGTLGQAVIGVIAGDSHLTEIGFWYQPLQIACDVPHEDEGFPTTFFLGPGRPNPSRHSMTIRLAVPRRSPVSVKLYDVAGRERKTFVKDMLNPGYHTVELHAAGLPSGIYFCQMTAGRFTQTRRLVLLK